MPRYFSSDVSAVSVRQSFLVSMIGARRRQDFASLSICSTTTTSSNPRWSDLSPPSSFTPTLISPPRPILRSARRFMIPLIPAAWAPTSQVLPQRSALRDFCLPRPEPRPPNDVLNRSPLSSCSPSLAKFSRTSTGQHVSISTSTTTLPSAINTNNSLHPPMAYLTVNGLKIHHHQHCRRQTR